jgi:agmatine deiminase
MRGLSLPRNSLPRSPRSLGYRMPAEWEPHARTWLAWPHNATDWPGKLAAIPWVFGEIIRVLGEHGRVGLVVLDAKMEAQARKILGQCGVDLTAIDALVAPTDRAWVRDSGPSFLCRADGKRACVTWQFNAWAKYDDFTADARLGARIAEHAELPIWQPRRPGGGRFVLEGGAVEVDGEGTLLCTEECLLDQTQQSRNPGVPREAQERVLGDALGIDKVIWLGQGIAGDDTHGHVDDVARFVAPGRVVVCSETTVADANFEPLRDAHRRLAAARDGKGRKLDLIALPMPRAVIFDGQRLPASYANFYVTDGVVLVPTFNDPADTSALAILADCFPGREVVGIHAVDLILGLGALHCLTQQEPYSPPR